MTNNTQNDAKKLRNDALNAIDEKLDQTGEAANDATDDTSNRFSEQWNNLKGTYHDAVADNASHADDAFEHRMKAIESKAKAAGYKRMNK